MAHTDPTRRYPVADEPAVEAERTEAVVTDPYAPRRGSAEKLVQAIYLLFGIIEGLIAIRFILRLLGANPGNAFAAFIYGLTAPLIAPFVGLFGTPQFDGSALELHSIVAIIVYALLAWIIAKVLWLLFGETRRGVATRSSSVEHRLD